MSPSRVPATLIAITLSAILTEPIGSGRGTRSGALQEQNRCSGGSR